MAFHIAPFRVEREAGLAEALACSSAVYACAVRLAPKFDLPAKVTDRLRAALSERAKAAVGDLDLHYLDTILVSTGWNNNDDVFDQVETWVARHTPTDKQLNYEHDCARILGHITSSRGIDDSGKDISEDSDLDVLPAKFHLLTGAVLYKFWEKPELQEQMDLILDEVAKGMWYVSMECLFKGFDYALRNSNGESRVVARNGQTAFLTKHLRAYGGTGNYGEYRVGRLMRNIVFSGKGLVKKPANPESVILPEHSQAFVATPGDFASIAREQVYVHVVGSEQPKQESKSVEIETLKAELAGLKAENEKLKSGQQDDLRKKLDVVEAKLSEAEKLLVKSNEALKATESIKAELAEAVKDRDEARDEVKSLRLDKTVVERIAFVKKELSFSDALAAEVVRDNADETNEKFTKRVEALLKAKSEWAAGVSVKDQPKSTPAQEPPKSTPAKKQPRSAKGTEDDPHGEKVVDESDLDDVEKSEGVSLSTRITDDGVTDVQRDIATYFGCEADKDDE